MATVGVTIAGRTYRMACNEGEEAHLQDLARHVDATLSALRKGFGEVGDQRLVIMTALTVADELSEAQKRVAELETQVAGLSMTNSEGLAMRDALARNVAETLDTAADRLERIAQSLNDAARV